MYVHGGKHITKYAELGFERLKASLPPVVDPLGYHLGAGSPDAESPTLEHAPAVRNYLATHPDCAEILSAWKEHWNDPKLAALIPESLARIIGACRSPAHQHLVIGPCRKLIQNHMQSINKSLHVGDHLILSSNLRLLLAVQCLVPETGEKIAEAFDFSVSVGIFLIGMCLLVGVLIRFYTSIREFSVY